MVGFFLHVFARISFAVSVIMSLNWSISVFHIVFCKANFPQIVALNFSTTLGSFSLSKFNLSCGLGPFGLPRPDFKVHYNYVVIAPSIHTENVLVVSGLIPDWNYFFNLVVVNFIRYMQGSSSGVFVFTEYICEHHIIVAGKFQQP